jgi:hypothetical protein
MRTTIHIIFWMCTCWFTMQAQQDSIFKAQKYYADKDYTKALSTINGVIQSKKNPTELASAYQLQAFILKDYAKTLDKNGSYQYRLESLKAVENAVKTDPKSDVKAIAKYLSQTFNNDAAMSLGSNDFELSEMQFDNYSKAAKYFSTDAEIKNRLVDFKNAMASALYNQYSSFKNKDTALFLKTEAAYKAVLTLDPQNISANYSLGVLYYNSAIDIVTTVNPDETDIAVIDAMQDKMQPLFKQSKPYLEKASNLAPSRTDVLKGLEIVYFNLNDVSKYKLVQAKLKKLGVK